MEEETKQQLIPRGKSLRCVTFHSLSEIYEGGPLLNRVTIVTTAEMSGETNSSVCQRSGTIREERKPLHQVNEKGRNSNRKLTCELRCHATLDQRTNRRNYQAQIETSRIRHN